MYTVDDVRTVSGEIMSDQMWSETHVRGGGGGVMINGFGVGSSSTRSNVVNKREVWIRAADGLEMTFTANANALQVRPGHRVVVAVINNKQTGKPVPVQLFNLSTDTMTVLVDAKMLFPGRAFLVRGAIPASIIGVVTIVYGGFLLLGGLFFLSALKRPALKMRQAIGEKLDAAVAAARLLPAVE